MSTSTTVQPLTQFTAINGKTYPTEDFDRTLQDSVEHVRPVLALPRPWEEYKADADFGEYDSLIAAATEALQGFAMTSARYADLMYLLDSWFAADRVVPRQDNLRFAREAEVKRFAHWGRQAAATAAQATTD